MKPLFIHRKGEVFLGRDGITVETLPAEFQKLFPEISPKYIDPLSLLAGIAAGGVLNSAAPQEITERGRDFAVIVGSAFGAIDSTIDFDSQALSKGPNAVNPMDFPNTVANAAGSRIGIWLQLKGPNVTLTNGGTSFIDAIGFAFEGTNDGLIKRCLVGSAEKVPGFLKPFSNQGDPSPDFSEGACFLLASGEEEANSLFRVEDYFGIQLKPDFSFPAVFHERFQKFWEGVEWLGCPEETPTGLSIPKNLVRVAPHSRVLELGLGGFESLNAFLSAPQSCGVVAAGSKNERKYSFIKLKKGRG